MNPDLRQEKNIVLLKSFQDILLTLDRFLMVPDRMPERSIGRKSFISLQGVFMAGDRERFKRTELLLGRPAMDRLEQSTVTVIGLGAVGSHVIEALARSGVGTLRIVDFDTLSHSNVNRQLLAVESTMGQLKTEAAHARLKQINPDMTVQVFNMMCHIQTFDDIFSSPTDVVVDAMDSLNPKVNVLYELVQRRIDVVSCLGAARRFDPSRIRAGDISRTMGCPLARAVRKRLKRMGIDRGILCVYSDEVASKASVSPEVEDNFGDHGRLRNPMGSLPMITGIFGYLAALEALKKLIAPVYQETDQDNPWDNGLCPDILKQ